MSKLKVGLCELIVLCFTLGQFSVLVKAQDTAAEAARKNRQKDAQAAKKRVWTDDDFPSADNKESPTTVAATQESVSETLRKFRLMSKEEVELCRMIAISIERLKFLSPMWETVRALP